SHVRCDRPRRARYRALRRLRYAAGDLSRAAGAILPPMPAADFVMRTRRALKSFTVLYVGLGVLAIIICWTGYTFEIGLSPVVIAAVGLLPLVLGIGWTWFVKRSIEYRVYQDSVELESGLLSRNIENLQLFRVRDLKLRQSMLGRVFGVG